MSLVKEFIRRASERPRRVVLPEGEDERIVQAAVRLASEKIAIPIILGKPEAVKEKAGGASIDGIQIVDPDASGDIDRYAAAYATKRNQKEGIARRLVKRPLLFGAMMVSEGDADAMVAGVANTTGNVISAAGLGIGYEEGISQASSYFVMVVPGSPDRVLVFADCAVVVNPDAKGMAEIAVVTARNTKALLDIEPKVALLSFSTHGSATHEMVDKVREATRIAREMAPDLTIDGELQADSAIVAGVAKKKCPDSPLAGEANVLVFPDLNSANIGYKLVQRLAGAAAIGPMMQGFAKPVNDLSRGASVDDVVGVCAIAALQCRD